jgi:putative membrane protein
MQPFDKKTLSLTVLWALFISSILLVIYYVFIHLAVKGGQPPLAGLFDNKPLFILSATLGLTLIFSHSWAGLGFTRGTLFVLLAFAAGLIAEVAGMKTGLVFGGQYAYAPGSTPVLLDVPVLIPIFWTAFVSVGYGLVNSFFTWLGKDKPHKSGAGIGWLLLAVSLDGLAVAAIDFIMDPLQVSAGNWHWAEAGSFYGVPWGNFSGWFLVVAATTGIFRTLEFYFPSKRGISPEGLLMSAASYGVLGLVLGLFAIASGLAWLSLIGLAVILPLTAVNMLLYRSWRHNALRPGRAFPAAHQYRDGQEQERNQEPHPDRTD